MPEVGLKDYLGEINRLIEDSHLDEAVAHCRNILRQFPRYIDAYRLLGKALLEKEDMAGASDVFQRVLSADPEDFIAHAGLAIIRKQENQLNEAAWHMERAFEVEPYNSAIRDSLQDLVGRRDGLPPEHLSLTGAALARLYIRGELYAQAIGDLREALLKQPERVDLHVLLAEALWRDGQRIDAAEECARILDSLPDCIKANAILAEVLLESDRAQEAQQYLRQVFELSLPTSNAVVEDTVVGRAFATEQSPPLPEQIMVERAGIGTEPEVVAGAADWVDDLDIGDELVIDNAEPQWLDALQDGIVIDDVEEHTPDAASQAEIMAGEGSESAEGTSWFSRPSDQLPGIGEVNQETDWESWLEREKDLDAPVELGSQATSSDVEEATMGAIDDQGNSQEEYPEADEPMNSSEGESGAEDHGLDWLDELQEASDTEQDAPFSELGGDDLPDWLREGMVEDDIRAEELEWIGDAEDEADVSESEPGAREDLPDWLRDDISLESDANAEGSDLSWLDQIAAGEGPPLEEPPTMSWPDTESDYQGDEGEAMLGEASQESSLEPETSDDVWELDAPGAAWAAEDEGESDSLEESTEDDVPEDLEEAMAWLEQLAAQQGAPLDELPSFSAESDPDEDLTPEVPSEIDQAMDWLDELAGEEGDELAPLTFDDADATGELEFSGEESWFVDEVSEVDDADATTAELDEVELETGIGRTEFESHAEVAEVDETELLSDTPDDLDEAMAWLEELAAEQGAPADEVPSMQQPPSGEGELELEAEERPVTRDFEQDEAMAWLEELASGGGDDDLFDTVGTDDRLGDGAIEDLDDIPEDPELALAWLEGLAESGTRDDSMESEEAEREATVVQEEATPPVAHDVVAARAEAEAILLHDDTSRDESEQDAEMLEDIPDDPDEAMAWLERLAARQGAPLDELPSLVQDDTSVPAPDQDEWQAEEPLSLDSVSEDEDVILEDLAAQWEGQPDVEEDRGAFSFEEEDISISEAGELATEELEEAGDEAQAEIAGLAGEFGDEDDFFSSMELDDEDLEEGLPDWLAIDDDEDEEYQDWAEPGADTTDWLEAEIASIEDETDDAVELDAEALTSEERDFSREQEPDEAPAVDAQPMWAEELDRASDSIEEELPALETPETELAEAHEEIGDEYEELPDLEESEEVIEPIVGDEDVEFERVSSLEASNLEVARQALNEGRSEEALQTYQALVERGDDLSTLIADLEGASETFENQPAYVQLLGDAYNQNGQLQKALDAYRRALSML